MENYLLQPEAFSEEVSRRTPRPPVHTVSAGIILSQSDDIIKVTALTTISVANGGTSPEPGFGSQSSGQDLDSEISKHLNKKFPNHAYPNISTDFLNDISRIKAFDQIHDGLEERWDKLSRILDGKKSLMRLCRHLSESLQIDSIRPWEEMRGCLANVIASKRTIDTELIEYIDSL